MYLLESFGAVSAGPAGHVVRLAAGAVEALGRGVPVNLANNFSRILLEKDRSLLSLLLWFVWHVRPLADVVFPARGSWPGAHAFAVTVGRAYKYAHNLFRIYVGNSTSRSTVRARCSVSRTSGRRGSPCPPGSLPPGEGEASAGLAGRRRRRTPGRGR